MVTVSSLPPISVLISGGNSDSTTMPTSQNQLVTIAPHHSRASARKWRIIATVEPAILIATLRCGAPSPVGGISRLAIQQATANPNTSSAKAATSPPPRAAKPPTMVPVRMATKVAPSTSALPAGNSSHRKWSGRMPYLIRPNSAAITPKPASAPNRSGTDWRAKPRTASPATKISTNFSHCATRALSWRSASFPPSADRKKKGAIKIALANVISASTSAVPERNKMRKTSEVLRKLSLNAAKNWHQNSGAKRLESIRGGGMPRDYCRVPARANVPRTKKLGGRMATQGVVPNDAITDGLPRRIPQSPLPGRNRGRYRERRQTSRSTWRSLLVCVRYPAREVWREQRAERDLVPRFSPDRMWPSGD